MSLAIKNDTSFLHTNVVTQQHHTIIKWLSPTDFQAQQHDIISRRQEGTGQWLLDSPEFRGWLQGGKRILFCPGMPGAGKTIIAAIAIDHLGRLAQVSDGLAYLFCNYKSQANQSLYCLLSGLLKQLVQSRTDIAAPVTRLYDHHSKQKSRPSTDEIFTALLTICSNHARVYIVVDALDECTDQNRTRSQLIEKLRELQTRTNVRLLFTSRFIPEITEKFRLDPVLEVRASGKDVKRFIAGQWSRLPKYNEQLKRTIQDRIVEAVDGMSVLSTRSQIYNILLLTRLPGFFSLVYTSSCFVIKGGSGMCYERWISCERDR